MPQLVTLAPPAYAEPMAKKAAQQGDGPWGEAIRYWFKEKAIRQAHVVEGTGMPPNKVSRAFNGLNVRMDTLRQIAEFLDVPFESVLVSPLRRLSPTEERHLVEKLAADARHLMDQGRPKARSRPAADPRLVGIAHRLGKLPGKLQKNVIAMIANYEKVAKKDRHASRSKTHEPRDEARQSSTTRE